MKKIVFVVLILFTCFLLKSEVYAVEDFQTEISEKLFSSLDGEITDTLDEFGINSLDSENIFRISYENVFSYFKNNFKSLLRDSLKMFSEIFSVVLSFGFINMLIDKSEQKRIISLISVFAAVIILVDDINLCLSSAVSLIKLNNSFMLSFVPIFAIVITASGNPSLAATYNTLILGFSELISVLINYGLVDLLGCFFCLCVSLCANNFINFTRLVNTANRISSFVLGLLSSLFASLLTLRGAVATASDSLFSKGVRFTVGSLIPIIGSSISEAYSAILGSINIIRGSVAIVGIIVILIINFPVIVEIVLFNLSLNVLSFFCEMLECNEMANLFKGFACGVKIIGLLAVMEILIFIISTSVMLSLKGG